MLRSLFTQQFLQFVSRKTFSHILNPNPGSLVAYDFQNLKTVVSSISFIKKFGNNL
jgi:hypothetical protein